MKSALAFLTGAVLAFAAAGAPSPDDLRVINTRFAQEGLPSASVEYASDGRLRLAGQYRDRAEVQVAFSLAQQVVGVRWVAPTSPENVRYPGTESIKSDIIRALRAAKPVPTTAVPGGGERHALVVGVGRYFDQRIPPIENAGDDAKVFFNFLSTRNFKRENMTLLLEERATKRAVSSAMQNLKRRLRPNDTAVLYFSTHGAKPNDLGNVPIILYDTRVDPARHWVDPKSSVVDDEIKEFIEGVSPARVMVVLDVCYSGAAFAKIPGVLASTSKDLFVEESNFSTGVGQKSLNYLAGSKQDQEKILIAASGPNEKSWNNSELKQGYFTYYFIDELKGKRDVQRAFLAAKPIVQSKVHQIVSAQERREVTQTPQATFIPDWANFQF